MFIPHSNIVRLACLAPQTCLTVKQIQRASATTAGSGIGAGGLAAKNSGGDDNSTKFILGFAIGVPCLIIIVVAAWYFRRKHKRKQAQKNGDAEPGTKNKAKNTGVGKKRRRKEGRVSKFFGWGQRIKPVAGYSTEKQYV